MILRRPMLGLALTGMSLALAYALVLSADAALAQAPVSLQLAPSAGSAVRVTATIGSADEPGRSTVTLEAAGLTPGESYQVHVHAGSCAQPSASSAALGTLGADAGGRGRLVAAAADASAGRKLDLTLDWLADGDHLLDVHADGTTVACGAIPRTEVPTPRRLPATGGLAMVPVLAGAGLLALVGARLRRRRG